MSIRPKTVKNSFVRNDQTVCRSTSYLADYNIDRELDRVNSKLFILNSNSLAPRKAAHAVEFCWRLFLRALHLCSFAFEKVELADL